MGVASRAQPAGAVDRRVKEDDERTRDLARIVVP
jgi:hypothetical protein